jgi:gamma-glutamyl hercynylcysteine S-oxide synthase
MSTNARSIAVSDELDVLVERLLDARRRSDALFGLVRPDALYERPIPERHRIIFYLGHLEAFDWNLLAGNFFGLKSSRPELDRLFAFGIDPVGGGLPTDQPSDWPLEDIVRNYVSHVRSALDDTLHRLNDEAAAVSVSTLEGFPLRTLLNVAVEHRLMHVETLAYMLHQLPFDRKAKPPRPPARFVAPVAHRMMPIPAGTVTLGLRRDDPTFGWDNEYEAHTVEVPAFEIDRYKVTNRQYLDFISAGGYETQSFWSEDDWAWKVNGAISNPLFWRRSGDEWRWPGMFEEEPLPLDWPVYVSHAEASAYTRWAGKSLPTEAEWQRAAYGNMTGETNAYPWGSAMPTSFKGNFDFARWDPLPVNSFPEGESAFGVQDMLGNGWEWTSSPFAPYPGFEPFPFYRGYSADFFDGKHFVMKGGSARTAACMLRPTFRNWFQPHYQYVYTGFRCVRR